MASPQILRPFTSCYHTCNTKDPSFVIGCCQVRFLVLVFDHSVTTYSALNGTHVACSVHAPSTLSSRSNNAQCTLSTPSVLSVHPKWTLCALSSEIMEKLEAEWCLTHHNQ